MKNYEPNFGKFILGSNLSSDKFSKHSSIRVFVIEYLYTCSFWLSTLISIAILAFLVDYKGFERVIVFLFLFAFTIARVYSSDFINYATILWVKFKDSEVVDQNEFALIETRINSLLIFNQIVIFINASIRLIILILLIIKYQWIGILIFAAILTTSAFLGLFLLFYFSKRFRNQILYKHDYFLLLYKVYWEKDSIKNSSVELNISIGNSFFALFLIALYILRFYHQPTLVFTIYFSLINLGTVLLIILRRRPFEITQSPHYRKPYLPILSKWVSMHLTQSLAYDVIWLGFSTLVLIDFFPNFYLNKSGWLLFILTDIPLVIISRFVLANGTIRIFKRLMDNNFNIVVFRRFSEIHAEPIKKIVYPNLGAYGRITSIQDSTLENAKSSFNADSEIVLGEFNNLIYLTDNNWRSHIIMNLRLSDLIVFCWMEEITENMKWEFDKTLEICDVSRILIIASTLSNDVIRKWLENQSQFKINEGNYIILNDNTYLSFGNKIYTILKNYKRDRRKEYSISNYPELAENFADPEYADILRSGSIENGKYHNMHFRLSITIPEEWYFLKLSEIEEQESIAKQMYSLKESEPIYNLQPKYFFSAYRYHNSSPLALTSNYGFQGQFIKKKYLHGCSLQTYFEQITCLLKTQKVIDNVAEIGKINISQRQFLFTSFERIFDGQRSFHRAYIVEVNEAFLMFQVYYRDESSTNEIDKIFQSLSLQ